MRAVLAHDRHSQSKSRLARLTERAPDRSCTRSARWASCRSCTTHSRRNWRGSARAGTLPRRARAVRSFRGTCSGNSRGGCTRFGTIRGSGCTLRNAGSRCWPCSRRTSPGPAQRVTDRSRPRHRASAPCKIATQVVRARPSVELDPNQRVARASASRKHLVVDEQTELCGEHRNRRDRAILSGGTVKQATDELALHPESGGDHVRRAHCSLQTIAEVRLQNDRHAGPTKEQDSTVVEAF